MIGQDVGNRAGRHAIVIGSGIAGLMAARVLSDHFVRVTVIERDELPIEPTRRRWLPHGQHTHLLLYRGQVILERLFPGLFASMGNQGSVCVDLGSQLRWHHCGVVNIPAPSRNISQFQSRHALEFHVRAHLRSLDNVCFLERIHVVGLRTSCSGEAISGVAIRSFAQGSTRADVLTADLVVDASGRGSQLPRWLESLGYDCPAQVDIGNDVTYASRIYRRPSSVTRAWKILLCQPDAMGAGPSASISPVENDGWMVSLCNPADRVPNDEASFNEFLRTFPNAELFEALRDAQPMTSVSTFRVTSSQRRFYERLKRFPKRLVVMGDALCSLNPVYGQGMTVSAMQALELHRCLERYARGGLERATDNFRMVAARIVDWPWMWSAVHDSQSANPAEPGSRFAALLSWYRRKVQESASIDPNVWLKLLAVTQMSSHPLTLCTPQTMLRVLRSTRRPRHAPPSLHAQVAHSRPA